MVEVLDCGRKVNEFEFQSRYNIHFLTNTLTMGTKFFILHPAMG